MSRIILENISLSYPIYGVSSRSLKKSVIKATTGGYFDRSEKTVIVNAIDQLSFSLSSGDRLALIGHNGAGKSTLLRVLAGIYEPTHGRLTVNGTRGAILDIGFGMEPDLSGYDNIITRSLLMNIPRKKLANFIADIEEFTEIGDYLSMPVKTYSTGMAMRLAFAISTAFPSNILLIDEVIGTGDAHFFAKAQARLQHLLQQTDIVILASHSMETVRQFCNKGLFLEHGMRKNFGELDQIINQYEQSL